MLRGLVWLLAFSIILGCAGSRKDIVMYPQDRLMLADNLASQGKCSKAIMHYEKVLSEFPPPDVAERARFNLARCHMKLENYETAVQNFEEFRTSFPKSDLVDDAIYLMAVCYKAQAPRAERDQRNTVEALKLVELLLRDYPESNVRTEAQQLLKECRSRLAHKDFLNGELYLKMGYYEAARIYFDSVVSEFPDTEWARRALLGKAKTYEKEQRFDSAAETYRQIISEYPQTYEATQAALRLNQIARAQAGRE